MATVLLRRCLRAWLALALLALAPAVQAAPIAVSYTLTITYGFESPSPGPLPGTGVVDVSGGTLTIPAGFFDIDSLVVPVSASTAVNSPLVFQNVSNQTGTFRLGGVASQAPGELCPAPAPGYACNVGGGVGGTMAVLGSLSIPIIPNLVVIGMDFEAAGVGVGGSTNVPVGGFDAAAWTTRTGRVGNSTSSVSFFGSSGPGSLSLVTPTYVAPFGSFLTFELTLSPVTLVPEPKALVLLALGSIGLCLVLQR